MTDKTLQRSRCGQVIIIGRPNVGKSTLLNQFVETHLVATASRPQTTRNRIIGIRTSGSSQFVFIDTPGIHLQGKRLLNTRLNQAAVATIPEADVVLFVIVAMRFTKEDELVLENLKSVTTPVILVINKIDTVKDKEKLLPFIDSVRSKYNFAEVVPCSAQKNKTLKPLLATIESYLPEKEFDYEADSLTDRSMRFLGSELIREQLVRTLEQELPHAIAVEIETWKEDDKRIYIDALIYVEREGQKKIVIGKGGRVLKHAGSKARKNIEALSGRPVHLELWVKVKPGWQDSGNLLRQFGIEENLKKI